MIFRHRKKEREFTEPKLLHCLFRVIVETFFLGEIRLHALKNAITTDPPMIERGKDM